MMTHERWISLWSDGELTPEEIAEGWHFCAEMDGLLANFKHADGNCFCELRQKHLADKIPLWCD